MKTDREKAPGSRVVSIAVTGCLIIAVILAIGTFSLGRIADRDTRSAVRNVSLLYLSELAGRREQVVSTKLEEYIRDLDIAVGLMEPEDKSSIENLQAYQLRMKQLYTLEKFAFVDEDGVIYTSRGTRTDIDGYGIDYEHMSEPAVSVKNLHSNDKKVIIAVPIDNMQIAGHTFVVCFMEIDMENMLEDVSMQSNNNTTFCNIYTKDGIALTDMILGGLASEDNLLEAMEKADYEEGYSFDGVKSDFSSGCDGVVSFTYNGISETLYYVPIHGTDWLLTYLIRESIIGEQINSISDSIIRRGLIQSVLTAIVLIGMFAMIFIQQRQASKAALDREVSETENRVRQQELEEQLAMQEELASKSEELSDALQAAEDANRAKTAFVSNMSHEIRTPITAILGMNEMIRRESDDENILSYADNISTAGESLLGIISDILDFSKIEAGRMELSIAEYSTRTLINDLYNLIRFRAEAKGLKLNIKVDPALPARLMGDELRVKQVVANLLSNAVKYTEKGEVNLEIKLLETTPEQTSAKISIIVADTGIGIRKEEMDKLFAPFDRLDVKRTKSIEGTGLGLSITRQLLELMHSELMVESVYDRGSRFYFDIWQEIVDPASIGAFDPVTASRSLKDRDDKHKYFTAPGRKILVVDDMPMNLQVLTGLLKRSRMIIDTASGGEECIRKFGETEYDMVFLDYRMPVLDGIDTIKKLREMYPEKTARIPVIALTASAVSGDRDKLISAGFTDYLAKPVVIADMEKMMNKYLGGSIEEVPAKEDSAADKKTDTGQKNMEEASADEDGLSDIPEKILDIKSLDPARGLDYCGDAEDYVFALETYSGTVDDKARELSEYLEQNKTDDYILIIHSLKSMSKSIGAIDLSSRAAALEQAAKDNDQDTLSKDTPEFIKEYTALGDDIKNALA